MGVFLLILWTAVAAQRFVLPGGPRQRVLGVFSPKTVGCGVIVTTSQVLHYVVNANSTLSYVARYAVSNVMANPNRQASSAAVWEVNAGALTLAVGDDGGGVTLSQMKSCTLSFFLQQQLQFNNNSVFDTVTKGSLAPDDRVFTSLLDSVTFGLVQSVSGQKVDVKGKSSVQFDSVFAAAGPFFLSNQTQVWGNTRLDVWSLSKISSAGKVSYNQSSIVSHYMSKPFWVTAGMSQEHSALYGSTLFVSTYMINGVQNDESTCVTAFFGGVYPESTVCYAVLASPYASFTALAPQTLESGSKIYAYFFHLPANPLSSRTGFLVRTLVSDGDFGPVISLDTVWILPEYPLTAPSNSKAIIEPIVPDAVTILATDYDSGVPVLIVVDVTSAEGTHPSPQNVVQKSQCNMLAPSCQCKFEISFFLMRNNAQSSCG